MASTAQLAQLIRDSLVNVADDNKGIGLMEVPCLPFYNVKIGETNYEGEFGQWSASITQKITEVQVEVTVGTMASDENPYATLDTAVQNVIAQVNRITDRDANGNSLAETSLAQMWNDIGGVQTGTASLTDYEISDQENEVRSLTCTVIIQVQHRGEG